MSNLPTSVTVAVVSALVTGCAGESAGAVVAVEFEPVLTLGCLECEGPELFGSIADTGLMGDSLIYVLTFDEPKLRVFSIDGEPLHSSVRSGKGPNEIEFGFYAVSSGDSLISILRGRDVRRFTPDGRAVEDLSDGFRFRVTGFVGSPDGQQYVGIGSRAFPDRGLVVRVFDADLAVVRDLTVPVDMIAEEDRDRPSGHGFAAAISNDGSVVIGNVRSYELVMFGPDGSQVRSTNRTVEPRRRSQAELERRGAPPPGPAPPIDLPRFEPSPTDPVFTEMLFDDHGRLWTIGVREGVDGRVVDVFDSDLEFVGDFALPGTQYRLRIRDGLATGVASDSFGAPELYVWRLRYPDQAKAPN